DATAKSFKLGGFEQADMKISVSNFVDGINKQLQSDFAGNIGYGLLKKFALTLDYQNKTVMLDDDPPKPDGTKFKLGKKPLILVPVTIDGKGPFPCVIDTGASATVISPEVAMQAGLKLGAKVPMLGATGTTTGQFAEITDLAIGENRKANMKVVVADFFEGLSKATGEQVMGVIGFDFLRSYRVTIDYPHKTLVLKGNERE
ncbi:MAG: retropepsin-like aspartic protease, partial [Fimbriimonadaceae bacterium]